MERLHVVIHGDVQGVGFRYFLMRRGGELRLLGWVRNNEDGTVEMVAEGARTDLEELKRAAEEGPSLARVERVAVRWSAARGGLGPFGLTP
ncbi:MAG TPA: acylphosphatase [Candidatus Dormibacteraeota bacterium]|nr:acylphosphatase [Candidatus Dormibacteraeota bacterium]